MGSPTRAAATAASFTASPFLLAAAGQRPVAWLFAVVFVAAVTLVPYATRADRRGLAFLGSSAAVVAMVAVAAASLYPTLVPALGAPERSLTIYNAASSPRTQGVMHAIALVGMPLVLAYTIVIYRVFRGKVSPVGGGYGPGAAH